MPKPPMDVEKTKESFGKICEVMGGDLMTVKEAIKESKETMSYDHFRKLIREREDFREMYKSAKEEQAEICIDEIKKALKKVLSGELDPKAATSVFMMAKWLAEKYAPREYGDRAAILLEEMKEELEKFKAKEMNGNAL